MKNSHMNHQESGIRSLSLAEANEVSGGGLGGWLRDRKDDLEDVAVWTEGKAKDGYNWTDSKVRGAYRHIERNHYLNSSTKCG